MSSPKDAELERRVAQLVGQVTVLGMGLSSLLKTHPNPLGATTEIDEAYERLIARSLQIPIPEAVLEGMFAAHDLYLRIQCESCEEPHSS